MLAIVRGGTLPRPNRMRTDEPATSSRYNRSMLATITGGVVVAAAASFAGLHTMVPWSQLYGANFTGLPAGTKKLALTYDDGPNEPYTEHLLDVLAKHDVKATFFMLGRNVEKRPVIARTVADAGHDVGNHSYSHPNLIFVSPGQLREEIGRTQSILEQTIGRPASLFRPPFGGRRPGTFSTARQFGLTPIMWRVTCYDWSATSHKQIEQKAHKQIRGGEVILLHDGGHLEIGTDRSHTVKATDNLIRHYKALGYEFLPVSRMLAEA